MRMSLGWICMYLMSLIHIANLVITMHCNTVLIIKELEESDACVSNETSCYYQGTLPMNYKTTLGCYHAWKEPPSSQIMNLIINYSYKRALGAC